MRVVNRVVVNGIESRGSRKRFGRSMKRLIELLGKDLKIGVRGRRGVERVVSGVERRRKKREGM